MSINGRRLVDRPDGALYGSLSGGCVHGGRQGGVGAVHVAVYFVGFGCNVFFGVVVCGETGLIVPKEIMDRVAARGPAQDAVRSGVLVVMGVDGLPAELIAQVLGCGSVVRGCPQCRIAAPSC